MQIQDLPFILSPPSLPARVVTHGRSAAAGPSWPGKYPIRQDCEVECEVEYTDRLFRFGTVRLFFLTIVIFSFVVFVIKGV
jgi:hypothetical protein